MRSGRKWLVVLLGWAASFMAMSGALHQAQAGADPQTFNPHLGQQAPYAAGEVLVKFKYSPATFRGKPTKGLFHSLEGAAAQEFATALPDQAQKALQRVQGRVVRAHPHIGVVKVKLTDNLSVGQAIEHLHRSGAVEYAEPNVQIRLQGNPDDPQFPSQWGLHNTGSTGTAGADIKAPEAWDIITGGNSTIVAVVDTGVDYLHEDLAANMWVNTADPINGLDDDSNGFIDDYYGINTAVTPSNGDPMDTQGHGTCMAGIIGAVGNNTKGIAGVNWQTRIMALKFANSGTSYIDNAITLMSYARSQKAKRDLAEGKSTPMVMVLGWSQAQKTTYVNSLHDALRNAQDAGVLVVIAGGNDNEDTDIIPNYPASYNHDVKDFPVVSTNNVNLDNVISVGASDQFDNKEATSSYGMATVDLFAPGKNIVTTMPRDANGVSKYTNTATGTSYAAAHVAGACALLWNRYPDKDWKQIKAMVLNGAEDGMTQDFRAICVTEGRLNLLNSLSPSIENAPAIFSIFELNPSATTDPAIVAARADTGNTLVITGVNFGDQIGVLKFLDTTFPAANISSWTNEKIVATVPASLPKGTGRLLVTNAAGLTSRGACFSNICRERQVGSLILARGLAAGAQVGNDVWLIGGRTYWGIVPQVEKYSLDTNQSVIDSNWAMPLAVSNAGAAVVGTKIYVVGGATEDASYNAIPQDDLQIFDTATKIWETGPPLPNNKALMQCAVVSIGTKLYVFGGMTKTTFYTVVKDSYVYDTVAQTWGSLPALPYATAYATAVVNGSGKIWVMGGFSSSSMTSQQRIVQEYDPAAGQWSVQGPPHLVKPRGGAGGLLSGGKVYCMRGTAPCSYASSNYDVYADGEWYDQPRGYWMPAIMNYLGMYPVSPAPIPKDLGRMGLYSPTPGKNLTNICLLGGVLGTASNPYKYDYSDKVWAFPAPGGGGNKGIPWIMLLLDN